MNCINPLKATHNNSGDLTFSSTKGVPGLVGFELPCRKCLACRLNLAREKAVRCYHEAQMNEENIFLTLTYDEESLKSPRLDYRDFQLFMKSLREKENRYLAIPKKINYMVTGEYGELNKRPHWHAIIFNYRPSDAKVKTESERGDTTWTSEIINQLWKKGRHDFGSVTLDSANYVARYAAKKLIHGQDEEHDYHPIHKTSSRYGIGRSWIEKYYKHTFENGFVVLPNGQKSKIPRYYVDWCKKNQPQVYIQYLIGVRFPLQEVAEKKQRKEELDHLSTIMNYKGGANYPLTRNQVKHTILKSKFKKLQENLKL